MHAKPVVELKDRVRNILSRSNGRSTGQRILALNRLTTGWVNYFALADMKYLAKELDEWMRRRLRMCIWKQWRKISTRHDYLVKLGLDNSKAWVFANTRKGYWRISRSPILNRTLTNDYLTRLGVVSLTKRYSIARSS